jgi:hypothetical protein
VVQRQALAAVDEIAFERIIELWRADALHAAIEDYLKKKVGQRAIKC